MQGIPGARRWSRRQRCPICEGCPDDPRGKQRRCTGYMSEDGAFIHCSREEHAGTIRMSKSETYAHRREGTCACGSTHNEPAEPRERKIRENGPLTRSRIVATYAYHDESGALRFQVVRKDPKEFLQRRPDGHGEWIWNMEGTTRVLYRLPELLAADRGEPVYIAEGEKDVDALRALGVEATCNPGGAGKWHMVAEGARKVLAGRHVVIIPDADGPGRSHAGQVAASLSGVAASVRMFELPSAKDAAEWIAAGGTAQQLEELRRTTPAGVDMGGVVVGRDRSPDRDDNPPPHGDGDAPPQVLYQDPAYEHTGDPAPASEPTPWEAALTKALAEVKAALGKEATKGRHPIFGDTDAVDLLRQEFATPPWLITGLVTRGGITLIAGEPKTTKTWCGTELAIAVATGTRAFGEFFAERGRAAYIFCEDLPRQVRNRARALLSGRGTTYIDRGSLFLRGRGTYLDVTQDDDVAWIVASARQLGPLDLLVLDPLRDISSAAEDKSDEMSPVMRRLRLIAELLGCTVVVVHHAGKMSADSAKRRPGQRMRGSSAIHGSTDSGIYLADTNGDGMATFTNTVDSEVKGARSAGRFQLELTVEDDENAEAVRAVWSLSREEKKTVSKKAAQDADDDDTVWHFVRDLAMRGERHSRRVLRDHDEIPLPERRFRPSLERLLEAKRLVIQDGKVAVPEAPSRRGDS